jgi:hypothetical protein
MIARIVGVLVLAATAPGCCLFDALVPPLCENCGGSTVQTEDQCRQCCSGLANVEGYAMDGPGRCRCTGPGAGECR